MQVHRVSEQEFTVSYSNSSMLQQLFRIQNKQLELNPGNDRVDFFMGKSWEEGQQGRCHGANLF